MCVWFGVVCDVFDVCVVNGVVVVMCFCLV